jgi:hypothetical protein
MKYLLSRFTHALGTRTQCDPAGFDDGYIKIGGHGKAYRSNDHSIVARS